MWRLAACRLRRRFRSRSPRFSSAAPRAHPVRFPGFLQGISPLKRSGWNPGILPALDLKIPLNRKPPEFTREEGRRWRRPPPSPLSNRTIRKTHNAKLRLPKQTHPSRDCAYESGDMNVTLPPSALDLLPSPLIPQHSPRTVEFLVFPVAGSAVPGVQGAALDSRISPYTLAGNFPRANSGQQGFLINEFESKRFPISR